MLHTRNGWQEIISNDGTLRSYMGIFTPDGPDSWEEVSGYFPKIKAIIDQFNLGAVAHVSLSAGVLTVTFESPAGNVQPDSYARAGSALQTLLSAKNN